MEAGSFPDVAQISHVSVKDFIVALVYANFRFGN